MLLGLAMLKAAYASHRTESCIFLSWELGDVDKKFGESQKLV